MKITRKKLENIIKEELKLLIEQKPRFGQPETLIYSILTHAEDINEFLSTFDDARRGMTVRDNVDQPYGDTVVVSPDEVGVLYQAGKILHEIVKRTKRTGFAPTREPLSDDEADQLG